MLTKNLLRALYPFMLVLMSAFANAGTLDVTAPTDGAFVGTTNSISFIVRGATLQVTVKAVITGPAGSTTVQQQFTPNAAGEITGTLPLNFSASSPEGNYQIVVTATEPGNTYNTETINVILDVTSPKFLEFNPIDGAFVKGVVPIVVRVFEPNVKELKVQVNGQDIPNNTTDQDNIIVMWDTAGILEDGEQTIKITVTDQANNTTNREFDVTLDRVKPSIAIQFPRSDIEIRRGSLISVVIDITDRINSIHDTGVDVIAVRMDGSYIRRVALIRTTYVGDRLNWAGRIVWQNDLPSKFKIIVNCVDKAGNVATTQEVVVTIR